MKDPRGISVMTNILLLSAILASLIATAGIGIVLATMFIWKPTTFLGVVMGIGTGGFLIALSSVVLGVRYGKS